MLTKRKKETVLFCKQR